LSPVPGPGHAALGLRLRHPGATLDYLAVAGSALAQGLALRHVLIDALARDGVDGAPLGT
jgi:hypothetical protein